MFLNRIRYCFTICIHTYKEGKECLNYEANSLGLKRGVYIKKLNKIKLEHDRRVLKERGQLKELARSKSIADEE